MPLAPILVTVYNRYHHFKNCIESLRKNKFASKSRLFIAIDAPYREEDIIVNKKIIEYAKSIKGFKEITIFIRKKNLGDFSNISLAWNDIFNKYNTLIISEDDNVFSPNFLSFVNDGLNIFDNRQEIFSISGYNYPIKMRMTYRKDVYLWPGFSAWGVGIWRNKWQTLEWDNNVLDNWLENRHFVNKLNKIAEHVLIGYNNQKARNETAGDTIVSINNVKNNQYSLFPTLSKVRNLGHDGSGMHGGKNDKMGFHKQVIDTGGNRIYFEKDIQPSPKIYKILKKHFKPTPKQKLARLVKKYFINYIK